jgi:hypothetical protein
VDIKNNTLALELCIVADKFMISPLKQLCVNNLVVDLVPENVCQVYELAKALNLSELSDLAFKVSGYSFCFVIVFFFFFFLLLNAFYL